MKNIKKLVLGFSLLAGVSLCLPLSACAETSESPKNEEGQYVPPPSFEGERTVKYEHPDHIKRASEDTFKSATKVTLHYHNDDNACLNRRFYTWVTGVDGVERKPDEATATDMSITLDFNEIPEYKDMPSIFFIIKVVGTWSGQSEDTELSYTDYPPKEDGSLEIWTINGEGSKIEMYLTEAETKFPKIATAKFIDWKTIQCVCSEDEPPASWTLYAYDKNHLQMSPDSQAENKKYCIFKESSGAERNKTFNITFNYTARINIQYVIESVFASNPDRIQKVTVSYENLFSQDTNSKWFEDYYTYEGDDLGLTYKNNAATFKVWSPISARVTLNIYSTGSPKAFGGTDRSYSYEMNYTNKGVWQVTVTSDEEDLIGKYYTFSLTNSLGTVETVDPYVKAVGINGIRGFIYDKSAPSANPEGWSLVPSIWNNNGKYDIKTPQDLSIYEVHIRDLTMDETWVSKKGNIRGTYAAFSESGTEYTLGTKTVTTGFSHLEELGVNALQLNPVYDHDDDERPDKMKFNWGYNPLNYNCIEGGYSSDPYDPLNRIVEFKNMVKAYSENANNTRIIMDVVYNHVSSASASCFNKTMPKYYFRYDENWNYENASGCNNEVATDKKMMSKYIVDSLYWWATEYKIKGFRFDLMGIIDWQTMKAAKEKLYSFDPDIYLYGEGWTGNFGRDGEYHGSTKNGNDGTRTDVAYSKLYESSTSPGKVGAFNDEGRNALKGSNDGGFGSGNKYPSTGFMSTPYGTGDNPGKVANMMMGKRDAGANPTQTVNYASCHDNYTLYDQLRYNLGDENQRDSKYHKIPNANSEPNVWDVINASVSCHAAVMMSNGPALMLGGEELYRTKVIPASEVVTLNKGKTIEYLQSAAAQSDDTLVLRPYPWFKSYDEAAWDNPDGDTPKPTDILCTDEVIMYNGDIITHNSYKSSDTVNAFKWDRKIEVDGKDVSAVFDIWKQIIQTRKELPRQEMGAPNMWAYQYGVYNDNNAFGIFSGVTATKGYSFFIAGRHGGDVNTGKAKSEFTEVFNMNYWGGYEGNTIKLSPYSFVCLKSGF